jgi:uncharacterized membrane protein YfcA
MRALLVSPLGFLIGLALGALGGGGSILAVPVLVYAAGPRDGALVGSLTGLFGVGGGFVIVPALTLLLGLSMPEAIGTSLLVVAINSAVALSMRLGTSTIEWQVAIPFTIAAIVGVLTGKHLADRLDAERSLRWFAVLLVGVAMYTAIQAAIGLFG